MTYGTRSQATNAVTAVPATVKDEGILPNSPPTSTGTNEARKAWLEQLNYNEVQIQRDVIKELDRWGVKDGNGRKVLYWHTPNGGSHQAKDGQRIWNAKAGVKAGIADVMLYNAGQLYCLELKTLKGKQTAAQLSMEFQFREQGAKTACARGLFEAIAILERWGLLVGRTV